VLAGLTWPLPDQFMDLSQPGSADGFAVGDQAAVGVDRQRATDLRGPSASNFSCSPSAQTGLRQVDHLGPGVGVLQLGDIDIFGPDTSGRVGAVPSGAQMVSG
jgi:hypothetical protein